MSCPRGWRSGRRGGGGRAAGGERTRRALGAARQEPREEVDERCESALDHCARLETRQASRGTADAVTESGACTSLRLPGESKPPRPATRGFKPVIRRSRPRQRSRRLSGPRRDSRLQSSLASAHWSRARLLSAGWQQEHTQARARTVDSSTERQKRRRTQAARLSHITVLAAFISGEKAPSPPPVSPSARPPSQAQRAGRSLSVPPYNEERSLRLPVKTGEHALRGGGSPKSPAALAPPPSPRPRAPPATADLHAIRSRHLQF